MKQIDADEHLLSRYVETRRRIDPEIRLIQSIAGLLSKFEKFEHGRLEIDPVHLGTVNSSLEQSAHNIKAALDDFLLASTAERALKE